MAINQKIAPTEHDNESQGSTHYSSSSDEESLSCTEFEAEHAEIDSRMKSLRQRGRSRATSTSRVPSLGVSPRCGKNSQRARRSHTHAVVNSNAESTMRMMRHLHFHLDSLRSLLPPTARSSRPCGVIVEALRYRKALEKEIELLLTALPNSHQVDVRRVECGGLQIGIACKKKPGLMVALMETMESFGLHFANVSVSCQDDKITIDALSTQESGGKGGALKGMIVATITRFSRRP